MSNQEVIDTSGNYRVILEQDTDSEEPYNKYASPLLRMEYIGGYCRARFVQNPGKYAHEDRIEDAAQRWGPPNQRTWKAFEKYLQVFHGVTQIETYYSGNYSGSYWYATFDLAQWREYAGTEPGSANMTEYKAWIEGDVYGYVIQKRIHWTTEDDGYSGRYTWEDVDGCFGFYGNAYAVQSAKEALAEVLSKSAFTS